MSDERPLSLLRTRWDRGLLVMVGCSLVLHVLVLIVIFTFVSRTRERDPGLMTAYTVDISDLPPLPRLGENRTPGAPDVALKGGERRRSEPAKPLAGASLPAPVKAPEPPPVPDQVQSAEKTIEAPAAPPQATPPLAVVTAPAEAKPAPAEKQEVAAQAPPPQEQAPPAEEPTQAAQEPIQPPQEQARAAPLEQTREAREQDRPPQEKTPSAQNEPPPPEPEAKTEAAPEPETPKQEAPAEPVPALAKAEPVQPEAETSKPPASPPKTRPEPSAPAAEKARPPKTREADGGQAKVGAAKSENGSPKKAPTQAQGAVPKPAAESPKSPEPTGDDRYAAAIERVRQRAGGGGGGLGGAGDPTRPPSIGGTGIGSGNQIVGAEFLIYYNIIISRIKQSWVWVGHNDNLAVTVRFVITPDGEIRDVQLDRSSGDGAYDESVLRAVREANPLPPPPATHRRDFSEVELTFRPGDFREAG